MLWTNGIPKSILYEAGISDSRFQTVCKTYLSQCAIAGRVQNKFSPLRLLLSSEKNMRSLLECVLPAMAIGGAQLKSHTWKNVIRGRYREEK